MGIPNISATCPIEYIKIPPKIFKKHLDLKLGLGVIIIITQKKPNCKECFMMSKKVLILSSSPRKDGNSETLAAAFAKGAREAGHQVEIVSLREKQVGFCKGCFACLKLGHCVIQDDAVEIAAKMHDANVLVFATPVYYYCVSGQLKTMLDRANPLFDTDYAFTKAYLLATAAEDAPETFAGTEKAVQGWVDCFPRCALAGTVFAGGVNGVGEIAGHIALEQAYQMGKDV